MNSAERAAALIYSTPPQRSRDPLFKRRPVEFFTIIFLNIGLVQAVSMI
ncbi:MAG: hypothetical protein IPJ71_11170 [Bdellovibrionales bacterium]|nr:hypothetical protein [Bdellovibrionales bacterium]